MIILSFLTFTFLLIQIKSITYIPLTLNETVKEDLNYNYQYYYFPSNSDDYYRKTLRITTTPESQLNPARIYVAKSNSEAPNINNYIQSSINVGTNVVSIFFSSTFPIYIGIFCNENCHYTLSITLTPYQTLISNQDIINWDFSSLSSYYEPKESHKLLLFYLRSVSYSLNLMKDYITITWQINDGAATNIPFNGRTGFSEIIDISSLSTSDKVHFIQKFRGEYTSTLVGIRFVDEVISVNIFEISFAYMKMSIAHEICYKVKELKENKDGHIFIDDLQYPVIMTIQKNNNDVIRTELINYNFTYPISYNELQNTICFSSYNDKDIDFSFQIVYTDLLESNQFSMYQLLNVGTIYKRSLSYGELTVYKQPKFDGSYYNHYTHIKALKGKPVLYAFEYKYNYEYISSNFLDEKLSEGKLITSRRINNDYSIYCDERRTVYIVRCESVKQ